MIRFKPNYPAPFLTVLNTETASEAAEMPCVPAASANAVVTYSFPVFSLPSELPTAPVYSTFLHSPFLLPCH
jgi:hypothetical protein